MLSTYLRSMREAAGLTQAQLGERLGLGQTSISNIEVGRQGIDARNLAGWLDSLGANSEQRLEALRLAGCTAPADGVAAGEAP